MTYHLAKQLKAAGFPHNWCSEDDCSCLTNGENSLCFPTLSELIAACEQVDGFKGGDVFTLKKDGDWEAYYGYWDIDSQMEMYGITGYGITPEEAVARLWLALNKK
jgi:hypothetical protein